jgi:NAD-dependent SIR2 family protein deacetylase
VRPDPAPIAARRHRPPCAPLTRRRPPAHRSAGPPPLEALLAAAAAARSIVVFTGSGLSAASGMSTFSTPGGLYERAARAYSLADGKALFTHAFFARRRADALAFLADVHAEAAAARPAPAHAALAALAATGALRRHYTLNVDGLAAAAGLSTWTPTAPGGATVEMHGSVRELVCAACGAAAPATPAAVAAMRAREVVPCGACAAGEGLRFRLMLYDDADAEHISPDAVLDALDADVAAADLILWVGISFQQSASTAYFRRARARARPGVPQAIINPSEDARWNLLTACSNQRACLCLYSC